MKIIRANRVFWICLLLLGGFSVLLADEWPTPLIREQFSPDRGRFVRVTPGQSWGDVVGFAGSPKGPYAQAEFYERGDRGAYVPYATVTLVHPVAPVHFFVTDRGFVATLDNWHNVGYGKVFALYSPAGELVRSYELGDLFLKNEIDRLEQSVSSITWHKGPVYLQDDQSLLFVTLDDQGGSLTFNTETGAYQHCQWQRQGFACRGSSNPNRTGQPLNANQ